MPWFKCLPSQIKHNIHHEQSYSNSNKKKTNPKAVCHFELLQCTPLTTWWQWSYCTALRRQCLGLSQLSLSLSLSRTGRQPIAGVLPSLNNVQQRHHQHLTNTERERSRASLSTKVLRRLSAWSFFPEKSPNWWCWERDCVHGGPGVGAGVKGPAGELNHLPSEPQRVMGEMGLEEWSCVLLFDCECVSAYMCVCVCLCARALWVIFFHVPWRKVTFMAV